MSELRGDIVKRLREESDCFQAMMDVAGENQWDVFAEAAAEIERLRALLPGEREPNGCCIVCVEAVTNNCEYICERCCGEVAHSWHNGREP